MAQKCKYCGEELEDRAKFCTSCGKSTTGAETLELDDNDNEDEELLDEYNQDDDIDEEDDIVINSLSEAPPIKPRKIKEDELEIETTPSVIVPTEVNKDNIKSSFITEYPSELQQMPQVKPEDVVQRKQIIEDDETPEVPNDGQYHPVISKNSARKDPNAGKRKTLRIIVIIAAFLAIIAVGIAGVSFYKAYKESKKSNDDGIPTMIGNMAAQRVGSAEYGFVSIPTTWTKFSSPEGGKSLQYSDGTGWIVTIFATSMQETTPVAYSEAIVNNMNQMGAENVKVEQTTLNDFSGYKVSGYYKNVNVYITAWIVDGKDSKSHYISLEGPGPLTEDNSYYEIIKSFRPNK